MQKLLLCLLSAAIMVNAKAQNNSIRMHADQHNSGLQFDTLTRKDPNGWEFMQVRGDGSIWAEGNLHNGIKEGVWSSFWPTGYPRFVSSYADGKLNGPSLEVDITGFIVTEENYKNDMLEGPQRHFLKGSTHMLEETYYSNGKKHGSYKKWYPNGILQEESNYDYDKQDGHTIYYYEDGTKAGDYNFHNDMMDGDAASYYPNGKVSDMGTFKDNIEVGRWKEFYDNGNIKAEGEYKDGEKNGLWKQYDTSGKYIKTIKYRNGEEKK